MAAIMRIKPFLRNLVLTPSLGPGGGDKVGAMAANVRQGARIQLVGIRLTGTALVGMF
jgi:hypothetical protein